MNTSLTFVSWAVGLSLLLFMGYFFFLRKFDSLIKTGSYLRFKGETPLFIFTFSLLCFSSFMSTLFTTGQGPSDLNEKGVFLLHRLPLFFCASLILSCLVGWLLHFTHLLPHKTQRISFPLPSRTLDRTAIPVIIDALSLVLPLCVGFPSFVLTVPEFMRGVWKLFL